jgi:hypothetical protein
MPRGPQRPTKAALLKIPSSRLRLARGCSPPSGGLRPVRGGALPSNGLRLARGTVPPRAGSASLEGPPHPRPGSSSLEGAPHACACPRTRAFNALTPAGRRHHAPGARAPVPPHQLPRREPIPITVGGGGLCNAAGASPVTPPAWSGTANAPSPQRGAGCTLDLLSCDLTGLGGGARPVGRHPCHCYGMAAAPARTGARQALWQRLQHCGACGNGTPPYLSLCSVRADVSSSLEPIRRHHSHPPPFYPRSRHCSGTR